MLHTLERDFYIPKGATKVADKLSTGVAYIWINSSGKPCAMAFYGKAKKPTFRYYFNTEAAREHRVRCFFQNCREIEARKASQKVEQAAARAKPHTLEVGHVLVCSWGYEQTNIDFYQVTRIVGAHTVEIREIGATTIEHTAWAQGNCVPLIDSFKGEPMIKRVQPGNSIRIESYARAYLWDGKPEHWTAYH